MADRATLFALRRVVVLPPSASGLFWFGTGSARHHRALPAAGGLNEWRQRRRVWPATPDDELPYVSVVLAAYNEEKVIRRTLDVLRESDYPADEVRGDRGQRRLQGLHPGDPARLRVGRS